MDQHLSEYKGKSILITGGAGCSSSSLTHPKARMTPGYEPKMPIETGIKGSITGY